jgi:hypothetical protein
MKTFSFITLSLPLAFFTAFASTTEKELPPGPYLAKCLHCHISHNNVECECHDVTGRRSVTSIDQSRCSDSINYDPVEGRLECFRYIKFNALEDASSDTMAAIMWSATMAIPTYILAKCCCKQCLRCSPKVKTAFMVYVGVILFLFITKLDEINPYGPLVLHDAKPQK